MTRICTIECRESLSQLEKSVSSFFEEHGFSVEKGNSESDESKIQLFARNEEQSFANLCKLPRPEAADIIIANLKDSTRIELRLTPSTVLRRFFHVRAFASIGMLALAIELSKFAKENAALVWPTLLLFALGGIIFFRTLTTGLRTLGTGRFVGKLAERVKFLSESHATVRGFHPDLPDILIPLGISLIACVFAYTHETIPGGISFIAVMFILLGLLVLLAWKGEYLKRFLMGITGLRTGMLFAFYSTLPFGISLLTKSKVQADLVSLLPKDWINKLSNIGIIQDILPGSSESNLSSILVVVMCAYAFFPIILFALASVMARLSLLSFLKDMDSFRITMLNENENKVDEMRLNAFVQIIVLVLLAPLTLYGAYTVLSSFEWALSGNTLILHSSSAKSLFDNMIILLGITYGDGLSVYEAQGIVRLVLFLYGLPVVVLVALVLIKVGNYVFGSLCDIFPNKAGNAVPSPIVMALLKGIARYAKKKMPKLIVLDTPIIGASVRVPVLPFLRARITLSKGSMEQLSDVQLGCLLAHEMGHTIQKRSRWFNLLNLISQLTFLGNGWLLGGLDSFRGETDADAFALSWAGEYAGRDEGRLALLGLFERFREQEVLLAMSMACQKQGDDHRAVMAPWLPNHLKRDIESYNNVNIIKRLIIAVRIYYEVYLGNTILLYLHPSLARRIALIKAM